LKTLNSTPTSVEFQGQLVDIYEAGLRIRETFTVEIPDALKNEAEVNFELIL